MKFTRHMPGYVLLGVVFWLPIGVAILVGSYVFGILEPLGKDLLELILSDRPTYPAVGIAVWVVIMLITGLLVKSTTIGRYASAVPILGPFFLRMDEGTMTIDRLMHLAPCLFLYSPTCLSYGWIL